MATFTQSLPAFMQEHSSEIYEDIITEITNSLGEDGLEFRGFFSMKASKSSIRNSIKFKDLSKKE